MGKVCPPARETQLTIELANGSRIISLPSNEEGIRCYSGVNLLVIDEAARVSDDLYRAVRPMLAVSHGRLIAMSTPFGRRGWYFESWESPRNWRRTKITADQCPRITPEFLAEERQALASAGSARSISVPSRRRLTLCSPPRTSRPPVRAALTET